MLHLARHASIISICGKDSLANSARREATSRAAPGDAGCADVREDDAAAKEQKDHSQGRPGGRARVDAIRYQSLYRRKFGYLPGRQTPPPGFGDQRPETARRLLAGPLGRPPGYAVL